MVWRARPLPLRPSRFAPPRRRISAASSSGGPVASASAVPASDAPPSLLRYVRFSSSSDGEPSVREATVRELSREFQIAVVDVASLRTRTRKPRIAAVSPNCIVLRVASVQALITPEHVSLFCRPTTAGLAAFYEDLQAVLRRDAFASAAPFELRALEAVMASVMARYRRRFDVVEPLARSCMQRMAGTKAGGHASMGWLWRLMPLRESLASFEGHLRGLSATLEDALSSDEQMLRMMLSERRRAGGGGALPPLERHEEVETLLERHHRDASDLLEHVGLLRQSIETAVDTLNTALDAQRNRMLTLNLRLSMAMVGLSSAAAGAAVFGMNLHSGLEEVGGGMWAAAVVLGGGSAAAYTAIARHVRGEAGAAGRITADAEAVRLVYQHADDVAEEVRQFARSGGGDEMTPEELQRLVRRSTGGTGVSDEDLDLILGALDQVRARYRQ